MATDFLQRFDMMAKVGADLDTGFMGTTKYELRNLLEQYYNPARHDITGVFEADRFDTNTNERAHCVVMICEQLNPGLLDNNQTIVEDTQPISSSPSSTPSTSSTRYWENRLIFDSCFNPYDNGSFIENFTQVQGQLDSFPGGYLHLFAATMPFGLKPVGDMPGLLNEDDLLAIKLALYKLPASKRNFVVSSSLLSFSSSSSSNLSSGEFLYELAAIWYDRDSKRIWVPENTVRNWYAHESETAQQRKQRTRDPQKQFEEFWMRFVESWEHCCVRWGYAPDIQKVSSSFQLCFRDRDGNGNGNGNGNSSSRSQGSSSFSDSTVSSPASDKGWTMVEDGN